MTKNAKSMVKVSQKQVDFAQAKAINNLNRTVKKLTKAAYVDSHFVDTAATLSPGGTAVVGVVTAIAQGDGEQNRDGDQIGLTSISSRLTIVPNASSTVDAFRLIFFKWMGPTLGTAPTASQVLAASTNINSQYNPDYANSLKILYDRNFDASAVRGTKHIKVYNKLGGARATYTGSASNEWNEGHVFLLLLGLQNTNVASINHVTRIRFHP